MITSFLLEGQDPGLSPEDMAASEATLRKLAEDLKAHVIHLRDRSARVATNTVHSPQSTQTAPVLTELATTQPNKKKKKGARNPSGHTDNPMAPASKAANSTTTTTTASSGENTAPSSQPAVAGDWLVKDVLLRQVIGEQDFIDIRVAVVGNVDAGKSTMLGVLTHGELDNGRGKVRKYLFRHKHEIESGRTSSVGNDILGFDADGKVVNRPVHGKLDWAQVCQEATKVSSRFIVLLVRCVGRLSYLRLLCDSST